MENNFEKIEKETPTDDLNRRNFLKLIGAAGLGLALGQVESVFSQQRERTVGRTKETRERRVFKIVTLEQILEKIRTTEEERGYLITNKSNPGEYLEYPKVGTLDSISIDLYFLPHEGINRLIVAHTHRVHGSIREQFRTMPPYPPSLIDWRSAAIRTKELSINNIKVSNEVIELTGIWSIDFMETKKTNRFLKFLNEERALCEDMFSQRLLNLLGGKVNFSNLLREFRIMDINSKKFQLLWQDETFKEIILTCRKIDSLLKNKYPEIFTDTKRIFQIQNEIMATANTNDRTKRMALAREHGQIAQKYGFKVEYKPF